MKINNSEGTLIIYRDGRKTEIGIVAGEKKEKLVVVNSKSASTAIKMERIIFSKGHFCQKGTVLARGKESLAQLQKNVQKNSETIDLAELWELLVDEEDSLSLEEMASYLTDSPAVEEVVALNQTLGENSTYFKLKGELFSLCSREAVEESLRQKEAIQKRLEYQKLFIQNVLGALGKEEGTLSSLENEFPDSLDLLRQYAAWQSSFQRKEEADRIIELLLEEKKRYTNSKKPNEPRENQKNTELPFPLWQQGQPFEIAFKILVNLGLLDKNENLGLIKHNIRPVFSKSLLQYSETVIKPGKENHLVEDNFYRSHLDLPIVTIDDPDTQEVDDGVSLSRLENGWEIGVHIADPGFLVQIDDPLDREAYARASTLYLPDRPIYMLPKDISCQAASLVAGQKRRAISFFIHLNNSPDEPPQLRITPSIIRVKQRMDYQQVDRILEGVEEDNFQLNKLFLLAEKLRHKRLPDNFVFFNEKELKIKFDSEENPLIQYIEPNTPSRRLVAELMIWTNHLCARFFMQNQIPAIYRRQPAPQETVPFQGEVTSPFQIYRLRRMLSKTEIELKPGFHWGLNLEEYAQVTSPLRRYGDMVALRQLKSFLKDGTPVYEEEEIWKIGLEMERGQILLKKLERERRDFWLFKYLQKNMLKKESPAIILEKEKAFYKVALTDYQCYVNLYDRTHSSPGDNTRVTIHAVNPFRRKLVLKEINYKS